MLGKYLDLGNPVADHPLNQSLVSWWLPLPNNSGGSRLFDLRGGNHGTLTSGPTWTAGPNGFGAVQFDGSNDYVDLGNAPQLEITGHLTLAAFVRTTDLSGYRELLQCAQGGSPFNGYGFGTGSNGNKFGYWQNGFSDWQNSGTDCKDDKYHLWTVTVDSATGSFYLDGRPDGTFSAGSRSASGQQKSIGAGANVPRYLACKLGCLWVYSRALSASEVAGLYDQTLRGHPDTLRRWTPRVWSFGTAGGGGDVTLALTGLSATASRGTLTPSSAYALTGQSLATDAGALAPASAVPLTGQVATVSPGTLTPTSTLPLTGSAATVSQGALTSAVSQALTGASATAAQGSVTPSLTAALTGAAATAAQGALTPTAAYALTGSSATASPGNVTPSSAYALTGRSATASGGALAPASSVPLTGQSVTVAQGVLTPPGDVTIALTGLALTTAQGALAPSSSQALTGQALATAQGALAAAIAQAMSGQSLTVARGTLTASGGGSADAVRYTFLGAVVRRRELPGAVVRRKVVPGAVTRRKEF